MTKCLTQTTKCFTHQDFPSQVPPVTDVSSFLEARVATVAIAAQLSLERKPFVVALHVVAAAA